MSKPTCLFIGRFQPFHFGHLLVVEGMTKICSRIVIGIGSSEKSGTLDNPFTADERREMIQRALQGRDLIPVFDIHFVLLPDMESDAEWSKHVLNTTGPIQKIWTGDEKLKRCFEDRVEMQMIKEVPGISSTNIRARMKNDGDWQEQLPKEVAQYLSEIHGVKRIQAL